MRLPWNLDIATSTASLPSGKRIYAVGDIHGCLGLLERLQDEIIAHLSGHPIDEPELVYLGDYCDRGPATRQVIDRLLEPARGLPPATHLKGNHEAAWLDYLDNAESVSRWYRLGGLATIASYGVETAGIEREGFDAITRAALARAMPPPHHQFLRSLVTSYHRPPYFLCHAGVRPGIPLAKQDDIDLIWIRREFTTSDEDFGACVVHGHTPVREPERRHNRINVDTGAFAYGVLTAAVLEGEDVHFLQVR